MPSRSRVPWKKYMGKPFRPPGTRKRAERALIHLAAAIMLVLLLAAVKDVALFPKRSASFPAENVAALQIPGKTMLNLKTLGEKYVISFPELLTLYCFENNFFPEKTVAPALTEIEQNFIRNYDGIKKKYRSKSIEAYTRMFASVTTAMVCFPIPKNFDADTEPGYMYGDSWSAPAGALVQGQLFPGTLIFDRENVQGRIPVVSVSAGAVTRAGYHNASGYTVCVETDAGVTFTYAHLDGVAEHLAKGAKVAPGQLIGHMGGSGLAGNAAAGAGGHARLRFGVRVEKTEHGNAFWINPYPFLCLYEQNKIDYLSQYYRQIDPDYSNLKRGLLKNLISETN